MKLKQIEQSFLHLFFPHVCSGCGSDLLDQRSMLCIECLTTMPETAFHLFPDNPVEKIFWGRLPVASATAQYYFSKESLMQHLMHQLKYKGNRQLGRQLGRMMGGGLRATTRFDDVDAVVPLPLYIAKEKRRGYNQAAVLCEGICEVMNIELVPDAVVRTEFTETQTRKSRMERWQNISGKFRLVNPGKLRGKHLLLVDDVITTGATLEACGQELMKAPSVTLSIATLCFASQ